MPLIEVSFVIASEQPQKLAEFYAQVDLANTLRKVASEYYEVIFQNKLKLRIYKSSFDEDYSSLRGSTALCFKKKASKDPLKVLEKWASEITKYGARIASDIKLERFGCEVWALDPDGNSFLIFVPFINWENNV